MEIPNLDLDFWNSDLKRHFWANLGRKSQSCPFFPQNWHAWHLHDADSYFSEFPTLNPFLANLGQKSQSYLFCLKIGAHVILRLLILVNLSPFLGKFGPRNSKLSSLAENWHTECLGDVDSYSDITFLIFQPKSFFGQIWVEKSKVHHFDWKLAHMVYRGCWFLFRQ